MENNNNTPRFPYTIFSLLSFLCVGGVLLSHNPTIAVPSAQSSLATGIGTGPGVPSTLKPPTQTHETTTTPTPQQGTGSVLRQTLYNKHKHNNHSSIFRGKHLLLAQPSCYSHRPHATLHAFLCRCISTSHLTTRHHAHSPGLSTPSSLGNLNRNLISKQASRLDAFSGYPSRT